MPPDASALDLVKRDGIKIGRGMGLLKEHFAQKVWLALFASEISLRNHRRSKSSNRPT
jgi:hypothetical protein